MTHDIDCLHHVGLAVADLRQATDLYERLGFQMTPPSYHSVSPKEGEPPKPLGTANVTATFPRNFVELVAHVRDDIPDRIIGPAFLSRFQGLHILTFNAPDADAVDQRLTEVGMGHGDVSTLEREVETEDGPRMMRVRDVIFGTEDSGAEVESWTREGLPEGRVQAVENLTPEYLLQKRHQNHPNGAVDLVDSVLCVPKSELDEYERRYEKYLGRRATAGDPGRVFKLEGAQVTLLTDDELDALLPGEEPPALPAFVAYTVAVRDVASTRTLIEDNGFTTRATNCGFFVPATEALGGAVIFTTLSNWHVSHVSMSF
jgi:catechol 2,3-dioxygenase-like lactoylglutathione lyase family enzyme